VGPRGPSSRPRPTNLEAVADTFYNVATPKFAAQAIRKASEIGWKPLAFSLL
jgi:branched-chain amino acid transport system substrate-binding protein